MTDAARLQSLQNRCARLVTGALFRSPTTALLNDLGWERLMTDDLFTDCFSSTDYTTIILPFPLTWQIYWQTPDRTRLALDCGMLTFSLPCHHVLHRFIVPIFLLPFENGIYSHQLYAISNAALILLVKSGCDSGHPSNHFYTYTEPKQGTYIHHARLRIGYTTLTRARPGVWATFARPGQGRNRVVVRYGISVPLFGAPKAPHPIFFSTKIGKIQRKLRNVHN